MVRGSWFAGRGALFVVRSSGLTVRFAVLSSRFAIRGSLFTGSRNLPCARSEIGDYELYFSTTKKFFREVSVSVSSYFLTLVHEKKTFQRVWLRTIVLPRVLNGQQTASENFGVGKAIACFFPPTLLYA